MLLFVLAYLGGVLTIISPCILPVLPFVFARADRPFLKSGLPMLVGMALTFAIVATLAAVAGGWAVAANEYGRIAALVLLATRPRRAFRLVQRGWVGWLLWRRLRGARGAALNPAIASVLLRLLGRLRAMLG